MSKRSLVVLVLICIIPLIIIAQTFSGKCVGVTDGDTIRVMKDGKEVKIRLDGIDCPESGQDFGSKAKKFTSDLVFGKEVEVIQKDTDKYGRTIARIRIDGKDLSLELVKAGLAWHYKQYSTDTTLAHAEKIARDNEEGLWGMANPVAPWEFRNGPSATRSTGAVQQAPQVREDAQQDEAVYITRTGAKYHRAGCSSLRKSMIPISKKDAIARGFGACLRCRP